MEVRRDNRKRTKTRGLDRFVVRTHKEYAAGLLPQREYVRGDDGAPFTTRRAAQDFEKVLRARIAGGASGASDKTFEDALEHWAARFTDRVGANPSKQAHLNTALSRARRHLLDLQVNGVALRKIRLSVITEQLLFEELFEGRGPFYQTMDAHVSRSNLLSMFKAIFALAVAQKWIPRSPAETLQLANVQNIEDPEAKQIDPAVYARLNENIPQILRALEVTAPDKVGVFQFLRRTGMRTAEVRAFCVSQLNQGNQVCQLKIDRTFAATDSCLKPPKNGKTRYSSISAEFANEIKMEAFANPVVDLELQLAEKRSIAIKDKFVFGDSKGRPASYSALLNAWRQVQFAIAGWAFFRRSNRFSKGRSYTLVKLDKQIDQFTVEEWNRLALGQKGLKKGEQRPNAIHFRTAKEAAAHVGITVFGLHDIRHLYASTLAARGLALEECADRIGDDVDTFKKHYLHCFPKDESADLRAIEAIG